MLRVSAAQVALACHLRVASPKASLGLPEVLIGLLPGAGGTQRLPRLVKAEMALSMITTGKMVSTVVVPCRRDSGQRSSRGRASPDG